MNKSVKTNRNISVVLFFYCSQLVSTFKKSFCDEKTF